MTKFVAIYYAAGPGGGEFGSIHCSTEKQAWTKAEELLRTVCVNDEIVICKRIGTLKRKHTLVLERDLTP